MSWNHQRQADANARLERLLACDAGLTRNFGKFISKRTAHPNLVSLDCNRAILKGLCVLGVSGAFAGARGRFALQIISSSFFFAREVFGFFSAAVLHRQG